MEVKDLSIGIAQRIVNEPETIDYVPDELFNAYPVLIPVIKTALTNEILARSATPTGTDKIKFEEEVKSFYRPVADKMKKYKTLERKREIEEINDFGKKIRESTNNRK